MTVEKRLMIYVSIEWSIEMLEDIISGRVDSNDGKKIIEEIKPEIENLKDMLKKLKKTETLTFE